MSAPGSARDLPERLAVFAAKQAAELRGKRAWGLPSYLATVTIPLTFVRLGARSSLGDAAPLPPDHLPLARLEEEPTFVVVALLPPHAVGLVHRDAQQVLPRWPSLDAFVDSLLSPGQPCPWSELLALTAQAERTCSTRTPRRRRA